MTDDQMKALIAHLTAAADQFRSVASLTAMIADNLDAIADLFAVAPEPPPPPPTVALIALFSVDGVPTSAAQPRVEYTVASGASVFFEWGFTPATVRATINDAPKAVTASDSWRTDPLTAPLTLTLAAFDAQGNREQREIAVTIAAVPQPEPVPPPEPAPDGGDYNPRLADYANHMQAATTVHAASQVVDAPWSQAATWQATGVMATFRQADPDLYADDLPDPRYQPIPVASWPPGDRN